MQTMYKMFLLAVEEMNFTRAAERAFVTQQCLSGHIKKLETEMGVKLFERSPRLRLTPEGEAVYRSARQMELVDYNLQNMLQALKDGEVGSINFGVYPTRAQVFLPSLLHEYHKLYPKVNVAVRMGDTMRFVELLKQEKLDLFLGVNCPPLPFLAYRNINEEAVYLIATNSFLREWYQGEAPWRDFVSGDTLDFSKFPNLPFVGNSGVSTVSKLVDDFMERKNMVSRKWLSVSDYDVQFKLCGLNQTAAFCPKFFVERVMEYNALRAGREELVILAVKDLTETLRVDLVKLEKLYVPCYLQAFIDLLVCQIKEYNKKINCGVFGLDAGS